MIATLWGMVGCLGASATRVRDIQHIQSVAARQLAACIGWVARRQRPNACLALATLFKSALDDGRQNYNILFAAIRALRGGGVRDVPPGIVAYQHPSEEDMPTPIPSVQCYSSWHRVYTRL